MTRYIGDSMPIDAHPCDVWLDTSPQGSPPMAVLREMTEKGWIRKGELVVFSHTFKFLADNAKSTADTASVEIKKRELPGIFVSKSGKAWGILPSGELAELLVEDRQRHTEPG